jgi:hypothetical protein
MLHQKRRHNMRLRQDRSHNMKLRQDRSHNMRLRQDRSHNMKLRQDRSHNMRLRQKRRANLRRNRSIKKGVEDGPFLATRLSAFHVVLRETVCRDGGSHTQDFHPIFRERNNGVGLS